MRPSPLFLIEFSELAPSLLEQFINEGWLPNFRQFFQSSTAYVTDPGEPNNASATVANAPDLDPWVQWASVHTGLPATEHLVRQPGDVAQVSGAGLARALADAGVRVGVCGSVGGGTGLNTANFAGRGGYCLPDPYDAIATAVPDCLRPLARLLARRGEDDPGAVPASWSWFDSARLGWFLLRHGLTAGSAWATVRQLAAEHRDVGLRWRRPMVFERLQYDVFRWLNRRSDVQFASFFCGSVASYQHAYWRHLEPARFSLKPPLHEIVALREAIPEGYRALDELLGRFLADYPDALLLLCTGLGQEPNNAPTACTFLPRRFEALLEFARIPGRTAADGPVYAERFALDYDSGEAAVHAAARFRDLLVADEPLLEVRRQGSRVFAGCRFAVGTALPSLLDQTITRRSDGVSRPFSDFFDVVRSTRSGRHHPDGLLWVRNGRHRLEEEKVPLTDIAPTILAHFGVEQPDEMPGRPLLI